MIQHFKAYFYHVTIQRKYQIIVFWLISEKWIPCNSRTKETSGTCAWFSCYESRGPTQCIDSKCICDDNYFTEDGEKCIPCPIEPGKEF